MSVWVAEQVFSFHVCCSPKDPIPLRHLGKKEVLTKINLMEDQYDEPMVFDESRIPTQVPPVVAGQDHGAWGYSVGVYGAAHAMGGMWLPMGLPVRRR